MNSVVKQALRLMLIAGIAGGCHAAPEVQEPPLFSATAQAYGFPFQAHVQELRRLPGISIVREESEGAGGTVGRSFFLGGCMGELCQRRGFTHLIILRQGPVSAEDGLGGRTVWDYAVGFTNNAGPDVATEFPDYFDPLEAYDVVPASFVADLLGGWPEGGVSESATDNGVQHHDG